MAVAKPALLALADGTTFKGRAFGAEGEAEGEVVFNTSMTGYQEILTDPSYKGQMVAMTCTEIGNVGVNPEDVESRQPFVEGFIVKECWRKPSNWRARESLDSYLRRAGITGIEGIDTRALVRRIRSVGAQAGVISSVDLEEKRLVDRANAVPSLVGRDLVKEVTCASPYDWLDGGWDLQNGFRLAGASQSRGGSGEASLSLPLVIAYDFGVKRSILRNLVDAGCRVRVVPASTPAGEVLAQHPAGVFLSNGPGDPDAVPYARESVARLVGKVPVFGICLGHQILGLALGGSTYKLKFGHHGGNQPVMDLSSSKVEITVQNHGFAVAVDSLKDVAELTHVNLNDQTVEGLRHRQLPLFSVQYHPEASPGPHDAQYLFQRFLKMMVTANL